jgi:hypothetical protein
MSRLVLVVVALACVLSWLPATALAAADDIPGTPIQFGQTVSGTLDSATKPNDVYSINLRYGEEIQLTVHNLPDHTGNTMYLYAPSTKSAVSYPPSLMHASTYNGQQTGKIVYTPAVDGTYFVQIRAGGNNDTYDLTAIKTGNSWGGPRVPDIYGLAVGPGTYYGVLDSDTYKNAVYAVRLFANEQVQLTVHNLPDHTGNTMYLYAPSTKSAVSYPPSLMHASTYNGQQTGKIVYTPAVDGTYFVQIRAGGNNDTYDFTVAGSAEKPQYPTSIYLRTSSSSVRRGSSVALRGSLVDQDLRTIEGKNVTILSSGDGKHWTTLRTLSASSGRYSTTVSVGRSTWYRATFSGDEDYAPSASRAVQIKTR